MAASRQRKRRATKDDDSDVCDWDRDWDDDDLAHSRMSDNAFLDIDSDSDRKSKPRKPHRKPSVPTAPPPASCLPDFLGMPLSNNSSSSGAPSSDSVRMVYTVIFDATGVNINGLQVITDRGAEVVLTKKGASVNGRVFHKKSA